MKKRIDEMVNDGGLLEVLSMLKYADMNGLLENLKMGVLQSIGYKEFHDLYEEIRHLLKNS
jgi:tRNA A37 N6-isopentenylltransferase MiaA